VTIIAVMIEGQYLRLADWARVAKQLGSSLDESTYIRQCDRTLGADL